MNDLALVAACGAEIFRGPLAPGHCPVMLHMDLVKFTACGWGLPRLNKWPVPARPKDTAAWELRNQMCLPILQAVLPELVQCAERQDVEALWAVISSMIHDMLNCISNHVVVSDRGQVPTFTWAQIIPPASRVSFFQKRVSKTRGLLHELRLKVSYWKQNHALWTSQLQETCVNVSKELSTLGCSIDCPRFTPEAVSKFVDECSSALICFESQKQQEFGKHKIDEWKRKLRISNSGDRKLVYRWLKGQRVHHAKVLKRGP